MEETIATEYIDSLSHKIQYLNHKDESSEEDESAIVEQEEEEEDD